MICPGGGYTHLSLEKEGSEAAAWLNGLGIAAFVLRYRLADYGHPAPLQDVTRALGYVRTRSSELGVRTESKNISLEESRRAAWCSRWTCGLAGAARTPKFSPRGPPVLRSSL